MLHQTLTMAQYLKTFSLSINQLNKEGLISAYHDRSDGGVITTLLEMAFASHCGLDIQANEQDITDLFNERVRLRYSR